MNTKFLTRFSLLVLAGLLILGGHAQAQTVTVNNASCSGASITITNGTTNLTVPAQCVGVVAQPPTLTQVAPTNAAPGITITLTGANLTGATSVTIGGVAALFTVVSSTTVTATVPAGATPGSAPVGITTGAGSATPIAFTVNAPTTSPPTFASTTPVSPTHGPVGSSFTLSGANFAGAVVTVGGTTAAVSSNTGTSIVATVPAGVTPGATTITATVTGLTPATTPFTVDAPPPAPTLSSFTPATGAAGTMITITGTNFITGATVTLGGLAATNVVVVSATSITATVPVGAATGTIAVNTAGGTATSATSFTVTPSAGGLLATDGTPIPNPSRSPQTGTPTHNGENGANLNAYRVDTTTCNGTTSPALNKMWWHNIDLAAYTAAGKVESYAMLPNESLTFKFTAPLVLAAGGFTTNDNSLAYGRPTYMTISQTPCDFDAAKANLSGCYKTSQAGNSVSWITSTTGPGSYCAITPGATYYFNLRFQDARPGSTLTDSCAAIGPNALCGGILQIQ